MATTISLSPVVGTIGAARTERRLKNRPSSLVPRAEFRLESNRRFPIIAATAKSSGRAVLSADPSGFEDLPGVDLHRHR